MANNDNTYENKITALRSTVRKTDRKRQYLKTRYNSHEQQLKILQKEMKRLQAELDGLPQEFKQVEDELIASLTAQLSDKLGFKTETYGPFGLKKRINIYFHDENGNDVAHLPLILNRLDRGKLLYSTSNGMTAQLPDTIDEIVKVITYQKN